jgi:hypothetical protein
MASDDTYDSMRMSDWDLFVDGKPADTLDVLLGSLGVSGKPYAQQAQVLTAWLESPAARPAPKLLLSRARRFISVES